MMIELLDGGAIGRIGITGIGAAIGTISAGKLATNSAPKSLLLSIFGGF